MVSAANSIAEYVARGKAAFESDSTIRDAILYQVIVIGEAAKAAVAADAALATDVPAVEWSLWARMRDRVTHQYWATDQEIVWLTALHDVSALSRDLREAIARLK
jgi:uncharacterized protein with HEPN domain